MSIYRTDTSSLSSPRLPHVHSEASTLAEGKSVSEPVSQSLSNRTEAESEWISIWTRGCLFMLITVKLMENMDGKSRLGELEGDEFELDDWYCLQDKGKRKVEIKGF